MTPWNGFARIRRGTAPVALLLLCAALCCRGQEDEQAEKTRNFLEEEHALSMEFETPHTDWAAPCAGGTTRVLFFTVWFQGSTDAREIIELMQRFDLEAKAVYSLQGARLIGDGNPEWYGGDAEAGTKRALALLEEPWDAVFINQLPLEGLPQTVRTKLRQKVVDGTGLVMVNAKEPFDDTQAVSPNPPDVAGGQCHMLGKGRIAVLPDREKLTYQPGWETLFDYQMAQQGRALLWAARHEPGTGLSLTTAAASVARASLPAAAATLNWNKAPANTELRVALRDSEGARTVIGNWNAATGAPVALTVPAVPEGNYHLEAFACHDGAVEDWAILPLHVAADRRIARLALDKNWAEPGETATGRVFLSDAPHPRDRVALRLVDNHGRILDQREIRAKKEGSPFSFTIQPWMPMLLRVKAVLLNGDSEISTADTFLRVTKRHRDQFHFMMWNSPGGDLAPYGVRSLAKYGVTTVLQGGDPPLSFAENELSYVPYAQSFRASSHTTTAMLDPVNGWLKTGCVHDEEHMRDTVEKTVAAMRKSREQGVFAYSLGDENAVRASCLSPHCMAAYRAYLKEIYGDVAALNREWNTDYRAFEQVELLTEGELPAPDAPAWFRDYFSELQQLHRTDSEGAKGQDLERQIAFGNINDELRALQAGNFARWYDRQAFQNRTYLDWCNRFQQAFKKMDPQAWTGFEGTDSFTVRKFTTRSRQGGDLDAFVREMDYFGPYEGPANEVVRSIARPGFPMGNWIGYEPAADTLLALYWGQITNCMNTIQWWRYDNLDGYHGYLLPTLAPFPAVRELLEDTRVVRDGLGTLLMHCRMEDDGIAMLYSMPSTYIAHFDGNNTYGDYKRDHAVWHTLLHDAGLQFRYVTDRMLRRGEFDAARCKVLLLPLAFAMDSREAEVIRAFVKGGGTVIADVRPALYDGHCKPLETGLLDDVFGIARSGKQDARPVDRVGVSGEVNGQDLSMRWGNWHGRDVYPQMNVDPSVSVTTGKNMGDAFHIHYWAGLKTPVCVVNEFGKGRAVLLNFSVFGAPAGELLSATLASAGVSPAVKVEKAGDGVSRGIEVTRWNNGGERLIALLGDHTGEATVTLPQPQMVYDVKTHACLGHTAAFSVSLKAHRASFFSLSEEEIPAPVLQLKQAKLRRGMTTAPTLALPRAEGNHAVLVRAVTPEGKNADWLEHTLVTGRETATVTLPFAHNDPPGEWKISATELVSGRQCSVTLNLR